MVISGTLFGVTTPAVSSDVLGKLEDNAKIIVICLKTGARQGN